MLNPGPGEQPLSANVEPLTLPILFSPGATAPSRESVPSARLGNPVEPALTPAEIRRRELRYEQWLKTQGLERVERASASSNNPY